MEATQAVCPKENRVSLQRPGKIQQTKSEMTRDGRRLNIEALRDVNYFAASIALKNILIE